MTTIDDDLKIWDALEKDSRTWRKLPNKRIWKRKVDKKRVWQPNAPEMMGHKIGDKVVFRIGRIATKCRIITKDVHTLKVSDCNKLIPMISYQGFIKCVVLKPLMEQIDDGEYGVWNVGSYCAAYLESLHHFPFQYVKKCNQV